MWLRYRIARVLAVLVLLPVPSAKAANVIVMVADGGGFNQFRAAELYNGADAPYRTFPVRYAASTFPGHASGDPVSADNPARPGNYDPGLAWGADRTYLKINVTDSAAAATAMGTGAKSYNSAIGKDLYGKDLVNLAQIAKARKMAAGVVTTVPWSHATPAGFAAHNTDRGNYAQIARDLLASDLDVIMGAGNPDFDDNGRPREQPADPRYVGGAESWAALKAGTAGGNRPWTLIQTRQQFQSLANAPTPVRVLGTFQAYSTAQQARDGERKAAPGVVPLNATVPTLAEMAQGALNVLKNNPTGFFLMIEGGAVDWACHANQPGRLIEEQSDFNAAVVAVIAWIEANGGWENNLLIVTADHETGYLTGPDFATDIVDNGAGQMPTMEWHSESHTNSLVPLFARGVKAELFHERAIHADPVRGKYVDNTEVFRVAAAALDAGK